MAISPNLITRATPAQAPDDRGLIRSQMRLGTGLIAFGALSIPLFQVSGVLDGQAATACFAVATAVIGAGAAMLPTGAAAGVDEDADHGREIARRQRATRLHAKRSGRLRGSVVVHGKRRVR